MSYRNIYLKELLFFSEVLVWRADAKHLRGAVLKLLWAAVWPEQMASRETWWDGYAGNSDRWSSIWREDGTLAGLAGATVCQ